MTPADEAEASENEDIEKEATHGTAGTDEIFNVLATAEREVDPPPPHQQQHSTIAIDK